MLNRRGGRIALLLALVLLPGVASAQFFPRFSARSMGMGGSFTAYAGDATAAAWNPACLPMVGRASFVASLGSEVDDRGEFFDTMEELDDLEFQDAGILDIIANVNKAVSLLSDLEEAGGGATGTGFAGVFGTSSRVGFNVYKSVRAYGAPIVDLVHIQPTLDPDTSILYNDTRLRLEGLDLTEYNLSFAQALDPQRVFTLGVNLRYLQGKTYWAEGKLREFSGFDAGDLIDQATEENKRSESDFSYDIGLLMRPVPQFQLGVVGHDLNSPDFGLKGGGYHTLDRLIRAGIAIFPAKDLTIAADFDIDESPTGVPGIKQREITAGLEKLLINGKLGIRGGAAFRYGDGDNDVTFYGGIGGGSRSTMVNAGFGISSGGDLGLSVDLTVRK